MNIGIVTYTGGYEFEVGLNLLKREFDSARFFVFSNNPNEKSEFMDGDNEYFEFSAYKKMTSIFQDDGPFLIINDTLFKTHRTQLWIRLIKKHLKINFEKYRIENSVFGDIRFDGSDFSERPNPFLASWIFFLHSREDLELFQRALSRTCEQNTFKTSLEYDYFIYSWLNSSSWFGGWHGPKADLERKMQSIKMEHRLSRECISLGLDLRSLGEEQVVFYNFIRIMDRLFTRIQAWKIRLKLL